MAEEATRWGGELWAIADLVRPMAVRVAATLRLADHIAAGTRTADALAAAVGADRDAPGRVLGHLVSAGVLSRAETGAYGLTSLGEHLRDDHPDGVRRWDRSGGCSPVSSTTGPTRTPFASCDGASTRPRHRGRPAHALLRPRPRPHPRPATRWLRQPAFRSARSYQLAHDRSARCAHRTESPRPDANQRHFRVIGGHESAVGSPRWGRAVRVGRGRGGR